MRNLVHYVNKKYDRTLLSYKKEKRAMEKKIALLKEYDMDTPIKHDEDCFRVEYIYSSLLIKRRFEDVFFDTYVKMYDYWYDITYLQRKHLMNVEIEKLKQALVCFSCDDKNIYMPAFSSWLNALYEREIVLLDLKQYHTFIRDCKKEAKDHVYGYHAYDHGFTSLRVCAHASNEHYVLFHPVTKRFYHYLNDQLDSVFSLNPKLDQPEDAILDAIAQAVLKNDEDALLDLVLEHKLYTKRVLKKIEKYKLKVDKKRRKKES